MPVQLIKEKPTEKADDVQMIRILAHGAGAQVRALLAENVPPHEIIRPLLDIIAQLCSVISPPMARAEIVKNIIQDFPPMVQAHVRKTEAPSGILRP